MGLRQLIWEAYKIIYYISTEIYWDLLRANSPNNTTIIQIRLFSLVKISYDQSEAWYYFFHKWENSDRLSPPLGTVMRNNWEWMFATFPASRFHHDGFKVCSINSVEQFIEDRENENTWKKKLNRMLLYIRNSWRRGTSQDLQKKLSRRSWVQFVFCGQLTVI